MSAKLPHFNSKSSCRFRRYYRKHQVTLNGESRRIGYSCSDETLNFFGQDPKGKSTRTAKEKGRRPASRGKTRPPADLQGQSFFAELVGANEFRDRVAFAKVSIYTANRFAIRPPMSLSTLALASGLIFFAQKREKKGVIMANKKGLKKKRKKAVSFARCRARNDCRLDRSISLELHV